MELAIAGSILQFLINGAIGVFETLLVLYAMETFHYTEMQIGSSVSSNGAIGVMFLLCFPYLLRYVGEDIDLMIYGLIPYKLQEWRFILALLAIQLTIWYCWGYLQRFFVPENKGV